MTANSWGNPEMGGDPARGLQADVVAALGRGFGNVNAASAVSRGEDPTVADHLSDFFGIGTPRGFLGSQAVNTALTLATALVAPIAAPIVSEAHAMANGRGSASGIGSAIGGALAGPMGGLIGGLAGGIVDSDGMAFGERGVASPPGPGASDGGAMPFDPRNPAALYPAPVRPLPASPVQDYISHWLGPQGSAPASAPAPLPPQYYPPLYPGVDPVRAADGGRQVDGPGTGRSDSIPAYLSDGEYVFPADVVSALGDGSNDAGADLLDRMVRDTRKTYRRRLGALPDPKR